MTGDQQASIRDKYRAITSSPEHQRQRLVARTRARSMLKVGFPLGVVAFFVAAASGLAPLYSAVVCWAVAIAVGWVIGAKVAARELPSVQPACSGLYPASDSTRPANDSQPCVVPMVV